MITEKCRPCCLGKQHKKKSIFRYILLVNCVEEHSWANIIVQLLPLQLTKLCWKSPQQITYFFFRLPQRTLESKHNGWRYIVLLNIPSGNNKLDRHKTCCFHSSILYYKFSLLFVNKNYIAFSVSRVLLKGDNYIW